MITFTKLKYQNFLAAGNVPIEITLNQHTSTLIVGRNGAGKSTMTEALSFVLFGRSLRNVNKPTLVNSINKRDALVEVWFHTSQGDYQIRRGIKPNVFEVYADGTLIPAPASLTDYQTMVETQILGMNHKSFCQIVVLGSASYVPFMRLPAASRRDIIEDLLDIEVFSMMSGLAKDELGNVKVQNDVLAQKRSLLDEQMRMVSSFTAQITEERDAKLATIQQALKDVSEHIITLSRTMSTLKTDWDRYQSAQDTYRASVDKLTEYETTLKNLEAREKKLAKERVFYTSTDVCPTCQQTITEAFRDERCRLIAEKETTATAAIEQCRVLVTRYHDAVTHADSEVTARRQLEQQMAATSAQIPVHERRMRELEHERERVHAPAPAPVDITELQQKIADLQTQQTTIAARRAVVETATSLLKDSGIKARVIKHYLPIINKHINYYLTAMDFPIHFTLDENFSEQLQSRHRDDFSYESFSEGEKKRIDLALLLTWRAVAQIKNSAACNVLILDEVFDSSLDANGTEEFLKIIHTLEKSNVFVISHKTDSLIDRFSHVMHFERQRGFSALKS
jgi:DNA repair exonuclease SbcCD ATPase subunit